MWDMFFNALQLFLRGRLFRNPREVLQMWLIGLFASLAIFLVLGVAGAPVWLAVGVTSLVGGGLQPYLFRNLKYD
jgi:hypothetical protein